MLPLHTQVKNEIKRYMTQVAGKIESVVTMMGQLVEPYNPEPNDQTTEFPNGK